MKTKGSGNFACGVGCKTESLGRGEREEKRMRREINRKRAGKEGGEE